MARLIIGSTAAKRHFPDFREPGGVDFAMRDPDGPEYHRNNPGINYFWLPQLWFVNHTGAYASPDLLYTIARAYLWKSPTEKVAGDIAFFEEKGCSLIQPIYEMLERQWKKQ